MQTKDESKIYRIDKNGKNSDKIFDESSYRLKIYDDKIYFLKPSKNNSLYSELSSIDKNGTNLNTILITNQINDYVIK